MISDTVLASKPNRISLGDRRKNLAFPTKNGKNLEEARSNSLMSATSTLTSSGIGESIENLSLNSDYHRETICSYISTTSTDLSGRRSSGIGESWNDLNSEANYDTRYLSRHMSLDQSTARVPHHIEYKRKVNSLPTPKNSSVPSAVTKKVNSSLARPAKEADSMYRKKVSKHPRSTRKLITEDGGVIKIDDVILSIGAGCLAKSTEITLILDDQNMVFKSLLDLGLIDAAPRVWNVSQTA